MMDIISRKQQLNREIKETIWDDSETGIEILRTLYFCEGLGSRTFKITIEVIEDDVFIDSKGRKWIMVK